MLVVYFSLSGQVKKFVEKLEVKSHEISSTNPYEEIKEPYILVIPTYDRWMLEDVDEFLKYKNNKKYLKGVAGSGNRNFGDLFVFSAKDFAKEYNVPMILGFEFSGTKDDVEKVKGVLEQIGKF